MANPFYPPQRDDQGHSSRGSIGTGLDVTDNVPFDPDRRVGSIARLGRPDEQNMVRSDNRFQRQQPTDGPGGAASFYPSEYIADQRLGTGTDGFGGGEGKIEQSTNSVNQTDYRATFRGGGMNKGAPTNNSQAGPSIPYPAQYSQPIGGVENDALHRDRMGPGSNPQNQFYNQSSQISTSFLPPEHRRPDDYNQYQYPPQPINQYGYSQSTFDLQAPLASAPINDRPDTPGIYRDRAPRMEKLTSEQKKIAESFPKDLDEDGGSLLKTAMTTVKNWRSFLKWRFVPYYVLVILLVILVALMTIYHKQIVDWLTPISKKVRELKWGWVIPVAILFVLSFPPLFGHEIIGVLCGIVYGLWIGFGILSLGTLLGELGNFYAFKFFLKKHGEKFERKSIDYACMAHIVREGGFLVVLMARLSAIPGHFTTAVFATVGMNVFIFTIAAILSLPKQLVVVYLGVAIEQSGNGQESTRSKVIKWVVIVISFAVTIGVAIFLYGKMAKARPIVQERLRERRYRMLTEAGGDQVNVEILNNNDESSSMHRHSKGYSAYGDETVRIHEDGPRVVVQNGESKKKGGLWSRLGGKNKGKETGQHEMTMQPNSVKMSFETDSMDHHKSTFHHPYDEQTLRPNMGMSYGDQYMSRGPPPHSADARLSQRPNNAYTQSIATSSSPERNVYGRNLMPHSAPVAYTKQSNERIGESQQDLPHQNWDYQQNPPINTYTAASENQADKNKYQHVANVGSIYHLPQPSQDSSRGGNYATAM